MLSEKNAGGAATTNSGDSKGLISAHDERLLLERMMHGMLGSELGDAVCPTGILQQRERGESRPDAQVLPLLLSILRGSLQYIPELIHSRLENLDYVSTQSLCIDFVKVGVAHHNLKCLVQSLQEACTTKNDPVTQAFAKAMENVLRVVDSEIDKQALRLGGQKEEEDREGDELSCIGMSSSNTGSRTEAEREMITVRELHELTSVIRSRLLALANICGCFTSFEAIKGDPSLLQTQWQRVNFPQSDKLLTYLHDKCVHGDGPEQPLLHHLFLNTLKPFVQQIHEYSFKQIRLERREFVVEYSRGLLKDLKHEMQSDSLASFGGKLDDMQVPCFLREVASKIRMSFFQYNILKEFEHCIPLLSFMEHLSAQQWGASKSSLPSWSPEHAQNYFVTSLLEGQEKIRSSSASPGISFVLTLDAYELERMREHYKHVSSVTNSAIDGLLDYLSGKKAFQKAALLSASKAKLLSEEKAMSKRTEESLLKSMLKREEQQELAKELKSAAAIYQAAKIAAKSAEKEADRLRIVDENQRRFDMIQEASGILKEEAAKRMQRVQNEIDRLNWRRKRMELQPKRLMFDGTASVEVEMGEQARDSSRGMSGQSESVIVSHAEASEGEQEEGPEEVAVAAHCDEDSGENIHTRKDSSAFSNNELGPAEDDAPCDDSNGGIESTATGTFADVNVDKEASADSGPSRDDSRDGVSRGVMPSSPSENGAASAPTGASGHALPARLIEGTGGSSSDSSRFHGSSNFGQAPLTEAMHVCIVQQSDLRYNCISRLCVRYFLEELNLPEHFSVLRKIYFMEAGDFGHSFVGHIIDNCSLMQKEVSLAFDLAVQNMSYASPLVKRFTIELMKGEERDLDQASIDALDCIGLAYDAPFPFSLFLNEEAKADYQKLFSFFLSLRRTRFALNSIWAKVVKEAKAGGGEARGGRVMLMKGEESLSGFMYFIYNKLQVLSGDFQENLDSGASCEDIGHLIYRHNEYLKKCLEICHLSPKQRASKNVLQTALQTILDAEVILNNSNNEEELLSRAQQRFTNAVHSLNVLM